jgi:hypothetical protein
VTERIDTGRTVLFAPFAGRERRFFLPLGKIADMERVCGAGIGEIMLRLTTHRFKACDIWEPIRVGMEGGGASEAEATATCMSYHNYPLMDFMPLAAQILTAAVNGVPREVLQPGKARAAGSEEAPGTSPSSTAPGER